MRPVVYVVGMVIALAIAALVTVRFGNESQEEIDARRVADHMRRFGRHAAEMPGAGMPAPPPPQQPSAGAPVAGAPVAGAPVAGAPVAGAPVAAAPDAEAPDAGAPDAGAPTASKRYHKPVLIDADLADAMEEAIEGGTLVVEGKLDMTPPPPPPAPPGWEPPQEESMAHRPQSGDGRSGDADRTPGEGEEALTLHGLTRAGLQAAFADVSDAVLECYGPWTAGDTGGDGRVLINFLIIATPDAGFATAHNVRILDSGGHDNELDACIRAAMAELRFQVPREGRLRLSYPLQLSARRPTEDIE